MLAFPLSTAETDVELSIAVSEVEVRVPSVEEVLPFSFADITAGIISHHRDRTEGVWLTWAFSQRRDCIRRCRWGLRSQA